MINPFFKDICNNMPLFAEKSNLITIQIKKAAGCKNLPKSCLEMDDKQMSVFLP